MPHRHFRPRGFLLAPAATLLLACLGSVSAKPVDPPMELLYDRGNLLVVGSVFEINPAGRVVFAREDVLAGKPKPPEKIDVSVPPSVLAAVKPGERYIVGYSAYRPNRRLGKFVANAQGPILLVSVGLEPALFRDTPAVRALLKAGRSESGRESGRFRALLLQALAGDDPQLQNLAAGEIALSAEIRSRIGDRDKGLVERAARDPRTRASARAQLLRASAGHSGELGEWWKPAAKDVLENTSVDGYSGATVELQSLVLDALDLLEPVAAEVPAPSLKRWLRASNPALAERAASMLRRQSPQAERGALREAAADAATPVRTRRWIEDRLQRMDRAEIPPEAGRAVRTRPAAA